MMTTDSSAKSVTFADVVASMRRAEKLGAYFLINAEWDEILRDGAAAPSLDTGSQTPIEPIFSPAPSRLCIQCNPSVNSLPPSSSLTQVSVDFSRLFARSSSSILSAVFPLSETCLRQASEVQSIDQAPATTQCQCSTCDYVRVYLAAYSAQTKVETLAESEPSTIKASASASCDDLVAAAEPSFALFSSSLNTDSLCSCIGQQRPAPELTYSPVLIDESGELEAPFGGQWNDVVRLPTPVPSAKAVIPMLPAPKPADPSVEGREPVAPVSPVDPNTMQLSEKAVLWLSFRAICDAALNDIEGKLRGMKLAGQQ
ncbi:unnamed protein product, partial [Mesorhabditis spiculigera]